MNTENPPDRWPRNRQRERVLQLVREHDEGAVDAVELAAKTGLHVTTVRFHLDTLCEQGMVARTRIGRAGVGRPRTGYVAAPGRLDYRVMAEILGHGLGDTEAERRRRSERAGRRWAGRILRDLPADTAARRDTADTDLEYRTAMTAEVFQRMGFVPELDPVTTSADQQERVMRLHDCPVWELAESNPELGCAMHRGLLQGLLTEPIGADGPTTLHAELSPSVKPNLCMARVTTAEQQAEA